MTHCTRCNELHGGSIGLCQVCLENDAVGSRANAENIRKLAEACETMRGRLASLALATQDATFAVEALAAAIRLAKENQ